MQVSGSVSDFIGSGLPASCSSVIEWKERRNTSQCGECVGFFGLELRRCCMSSFSSDTVLHWCYELCA